MNGWMHGERDGQMERGMDGWMDGCMHGERDGRMERGMDGWREGWTDGERDGRMDGWLLDFCSAFHVILEQDIIIVK